MGCWLVVVVTLRSPFNPETERGRCAGLRNDAVFLSCCDCGGFSCMVQSPFTPIAESSLLGRETLAILLTSPKAVRLVASFRPPACSMDDNAGLDLLRWCRVFWVPAVGIAFSSLTRNVRAGLWGCSGVTLSATIHTIRNQGSIVTWKK